MTNKHTLTIALGLLLSVGAWAAEPAPAPAKQTTPAQPQQPTLNREDSLELKLLSTQRDNINMQIQLANEQLGKAQTQLQHDTEVYAAHVKDKYPGFVFSIENIGFMTAPPATSPTPKPTK